MTSADRRDDWLSRPLIIPEEALREIVEAGLAALPNETGGLLFPEPLGKTWIDVLDNIAPDPTKNMHFDKPSFITACHRFVQTNDDWSKLTIWHTHPGGGVGPSRADMRNRIRQMGNLIIAITPENEGIPTWF